MAASNKGYISPYFAQPTPSGWKAMPFEEALHPASTDKKIVVVAGSRACARADCPHRQAR